MQAGSVRQHDLGRIIFLVDTSSIYQDEEVPIDESASNPPHITYLEEVPIEARSDWEIAISEDFNSDRSIYELTIESSQNSLADVAIRILRRVILEDSSDIRERIDLNNHIADFLTAIADLSSAGATRMLSTSDRRPINQTIEDFVSTALISSSRRITISELSSETFESTVDRLVDRTGRVLQDRLVIFNSESSLSSSNSLLSRAEDFYVQGVLRGNFDSGSEEARTQTRAYIQSLIFGGNSIEDVERGLRSRISDLIRPALDQLRQIPTWSESYGEAIAEGYRYGLIPWP